MKLVWPCDLRSNRARQIQLARFGFTIMLVSAAVTAAVLYSWSFGSWFFQKTCARPSPWDPCVPGLVPPVVMNYLAVYIATLLLIGVSALLCYPILRMMGLSKEKSSWYTCVFHDALELCWRRVTLLSVVIGLIAIFLMTVPY